MACTKPIDTKKIRLTCVLNKSNFEKVLLGIEVKTFSIADKLFPKLVYYCVPLGHTLVKSIQKGKTEIQMVGSKITNRN